jgi:serine/threonine protein kinase
MPLSPGTLVSHFRVISLLGRGGMGEVYHAIDSNLGRPVALKVLSQEFIRSDEAVQRFILSRGSVTSNVVAIDGF